MMGFFRYFNYAYPQNNRKTIQFSILNEGLLQVH